MNPGGKTRIKNVLFWLGLSLPTAALLVMAWLVQQSSGQFNTSFNWVAQTYKMLNLYEQTQVHIVDAESNQRGYLLTGRSEYLKPYHAAMLSLRNDIGRLNQLTSNSSSQRAYLETLEELIKKDLIFNPQKALSSGRDSTSNLSFAALTAAGQRKVKAMQQVLFQAQQQLKANLRRRQEQAEASVFSNQKMSLVLIAAVAMALVLVVLILMRLEKLQEFVTVCAWTGQVKFQGQWLRMDEYLKRQFGINVSHTMSQDAADKMIHESKDLNRDRPSKTPPGS